MFHLGLNNISINKSPYLLQKFLKKTNLPWWKKKMWPINFKKTSSLKASKALPDIRGDSQTTFTTRGDRVGSPKKQDLVNVVCERPLTEEDLKLLWFRTTIQVVIHPFTTATLYFRGVALEECTIMFFFNFDSDIKLSQSKGH